MSASKQRQARTDSVSKKTKAQLEEEKKRKSFNLKAIVFTIVFIVVLAVAIFINSNFIPRHSTAVSVGGTNYTATEFEYFYRSSYNEFYQTYSSYISYMLDPSTPLDQQQYSETETWADFFKSEAMTDLVEITALYDKAKASGYQLSEDGRATVESSITSADALAKYNGLKDADAYFAAVYGSDMNTAIYRDMLTVYLTASEYHDNVVGAYEYSDAQKAEHYAEIADDYDVISYESFYCSTSNDRYSELEGDAAMEAAKADAQSIVLGAKNADEFLANVQAIDPDAENASYSNSAGSLNSLTKEWLTDSARNTGDTTVIEATSGYYAVMYTGRDDNNYNTVNIRQVFVPAQVDDNGVASAEAIANAQATAAAALDELGANVTEDAFAQKVNSLANSTDGGLYETVSKGMLGSEFDDFAFDSARKTGDTTVVYAPAGYYNNYTTGYYVVYYIGQGDIYSNVLAENDLRAADRTAWLDEITAGYEAVEKSGMRYAQLG